MRDLNATLTRPQRAAVRERRDDSVAHVRTSAATSSASPSLLTQRSGVPARAACSSSTARIPGADADGGHEECVRMRLQRDARGLEVLHLRASYAKLIGKILTFAGHSRTDAVENHGEGRCDRTVATGRRGTSRIRLHHSGAALQELRTDTPHSAARKSATFGAKYRTIECDRRPRGDRFTMPRSRCGVPLDADASLTGLSDGDRVRPRQRRRRAPGDRSALQDARRSRPAARDRRPPARRDHSPQRPRS